MTNIDDFPKHLGQLKESDWKKLFDLLNEFDPTQKFGDLKGGEEIADKVFTMPYYMLRVIIY